MLSHIPKIKHLDSGNFFLIAGPCVIESNTVTFEIVEKIQKITDRLAIPFIFKASYRKANRSRVDSFTGIGDERALKVLEIAGEEYNVPTLTDIHESREAETAAIYVDVLQIPAFLCRQTDLLIAAAKTGKPINIKKGQFISGESMQFAVQKVKDAGNNLVMVTDRGNMFGYHDMVVDYRNIPLMKEFGVPVVLDCTHSLQRPNQSSGVTGGNPKMIETIAKAGIAAGADGIFLETHPDPKKAKSDGENMLHLDLLEDLLTKLVRIRKAVV